MVQTLASDIMNVSIDQVDDGSLYNSKNLELKKCSLSMPHSITCFVFAGFYLL